MAEQDRIEIEPNGPYVVYGDVPLTEMTPAHTFNGEPVDWHTLKDLPTRRRPVELCRCGQSAQKPFCDASHETNGFDGEETADRRPYRERARVDRRGEYAIADDRALCFQAGFCRTRTTSAWELMGQAQDPEKQQKMQDMVWHCPSGRLVLLDKDGNEVEPELPPGIGVLPGGPLWVRGGIPITGTNGGQWETRNRQALCRCGGSENKPFCDGAHARRHFDER